MILAVELGGIRVLWRRRGTIRQRVAKAIAFRRQCPDVLSGERGVVSAAIVDGLGLVHHPSSENGIGGLRRLTQRPRMREQKRHRQRRHNQPRSEPFAHKFLSLSSTLWGKTLYG